MNVSRLIWAVIVLAVAALLAVLNFTLPPDRLMFMVGDVNMPLLPPAILGIIGLVMLASAFRGEGQPAEKPEIVIDESKAALNKRLETIAWGLFLVMLGGFILVPQELVHKGLWSIGVGLIMLGLNATRYAYRIRMSGFTTFLGVLSLVSGVAQLMGWQALEGAFLLIILGAYLILKPWFDRRQIFGKAEQA